MSNPFLPGHRPSRRVLRLLAFLAAGLAVPGVAGLSSAQAAEPSIARLALVAAADGKEIPGQGSLAGDIALNLATLPTKALSVEAFTADPVGSVSFVLDGTPLPVENVAPYSLLGDAAGVYRPWTPTVGVHRLTVTAFSEPRAQGLASAPVSVEFTVTDAAVRSPWTESVQLPGVIEAENFDRGGAGVAYSDFEPANLPSGIHRPSEGVDIVRSTDRPDDLAIGRLRVDEWTEYTVDIPEDGLYDIGIRFASATDGGRVYVSMNGSSVGANVTGGVNLTGTDGYQNWTTTWVPKVALLAGRNQTLRLSTYATNGAAEIGNVTSIEVRRPVDVALAPWPESWTVGAWAPEARFEAEYTLIFGKLFAFGGFNGPTFEVHDTYSSYDIAKNQWTKLGTLPVRKAESHSGITNDGRYVYFAGGFAGDLRIGEQPPQTASNGLWRYDPLANRWLQIGRLPGGLGRGAGTLVHAVGKLHYFGGNAADRFTNVGDHFIYDIARRVWSRGAPMPDPKDHFSAVSMGRKIYAIGGEYGHDVLFDTQTSVHVYDVLTDTWTQAASLPAPVSHMEGSTFASNGKIVVAGGQTPNQRASRAVYSYDPQTNNWTEIQNGLPALRQGTAVQRFGNKVVVALGGEFTSRPQSTVWVGALD